MTTRITTSEFPHVIALLRAKLVEAGLGAWEIEPWLAKTSERLIRGHHDGSCAYFIAYQNGKPIGMAGALLGHDHAFLSLKTSRSGCVVDEYLLPNQRGHGLEQQLRSQALAWIAQAKATALSAFSPDVARLAASAGGGKL